MKTEVEKVAFKITKALSTLSNIPERERYSVFVIVRELLDAQGYGSLVKIARAAANTLYQGENHEGSEMS